MKKALFIGYDPRELDAFVVAKTSLHHHSPFNNVNAILLRDMVKYGHYWRKTSRENGKLFDHISKATMSTEFAITRFLTYRLAKTMGADWALFMDCDVLVREDINVLFDLADDKYAVMCVKHPDGRAAEQTKMDGQEQLKYARKNWSSVMLINCNHPSNEGLTSQLINEVPGRDLHAFCWLKDEEIGELPSEWNHLVGVDQLNPDAKIAHFTLGVPTMPGCRDFEFSGEWFDRLLGYVRG